MADDAADGTTIQLVLLLATLEHIVPHVIRVTEVADFDIGMVDRLKLAGEPRLVRPALHDHGRKVGSSESLEEEGRQDFFEEKTKSSSRADGDEARAVFLAARCHDEELGLRKYFQGARNRNAVNFERQGAFAPALGG